MRFETPDNDVVLLTAGYFEMKMPGGWYAVHTGLRDAVIRSALASEHADAVRKAVRKRRPIRFQDDELDLILRWSPCEVS